MWKVVLLLCLSTLCKNEAARILAYYPSPPLSHQIVFRPLSLELVKRGHEVVVITTDPFYTKDTAPTNLTEIDVHDLSYPIWREILRKLNNSFNGGHFADFAKKIMQLVELQINTEEVQKLLKDKTQAFDLIIVEAFVEIALGLSHIYKAPIIEFSSMAVTLGIYRQLGASIHPFVYPTPFHEKIYNLTIWDKYNELYNEYQMEEMYRSTKDFAYEIMKRIYGPDVPKLEKIREEVDMLFVNSYSFWDFNRPVPPNVLYVGGIHQKPETKLPEDLQKYLDSSKNGVIYVSFGTNVDPALFPPEKIKALVNVFSKLPYDVIWKWNQDELPGRTENIKISKWLPQSDLLRHPKIKFFVTQGGLQSTDEAITAGVPLIGIPVFGDQKFNVEQYLHFGIGVRVELDTLSEETLNHAVQTILKDDSFRKNIAKLRAIMKDQPQTPLERAVWWTEYVIRHRGAKHLRSPAANMSLAEYYELELVSYLLLSLCTILAISSFLLYRVYGLFKSSKKIKQN